MSQSKDVLFKNATLINEGNKWQGDLLVKNGRIEKIATEIDVANQVAEINAEGKILMPGVIDEHVHFRAPGLTHKADIASESKAAVAGGVTSFMEMPNTKPPVITQDLLEQKYQKAAEVSAANYSFYMGVAQDNFEEVCKVNNKKDTVCGIKIFMGCSTGNMHVDDEETLSKIFNNVDILIATHCEDQKILDANKEKYKDADNVAMHPVIRDEAACYSSSRFAVNLAKKYDARLHIMHLTTGKELDLFSNQRPLIEKRITCEVCVHHLTFSAEDYPQYGTQIQCNPAIKKRENRRALWKGLNEDKIDAISTDHAPHLWKEKQIPYPKSPSGLPLVQHSLPLMLNHAKEGRITMEKVVEKMCHAPATMYQIQERGFLREGYHADLVLINPNKPWVVDKENILYKCGWSPLEGFLMQAGIDKTLVNGQLAYDKGQIFEGVRGQRLLFNR